MARTRLTRRSMLRGAGGIGIALPFLEIMGRPKTASAQGDRPTRLVVVYSPHGRAQASNGAWKPTGTGPSFELGSLMAPLAAVQDEMVVVSGLELSSAKNQGGNGHSKGPTHALTCVPHLNETIPGDMSMGTIGYAGGISFDQKVANFVQEQTPLPYPSLQFGVQSGPDFAVNGATTRSYISYAGPGEFLPAEDNPAAMFDRLFGDFNASSAELELVRKQRKSVLDFVMDDFERINPTLGGEDKARLEQHLDKIREVEQSIDLTTGEVSEACALPDIGAEIPGYKDNGNYPAVGQQQTTLLSMALACSMTRVATFQWSTGQSVTRHSWIDGAGSKGHHGLTHDGAPARDAYDSITTWYAERVAELVTALRDTPDYDGSTLLDNTVVLWVAGEMAYADAHSFVDMPYVVFGGGDRLARGQHLDFGSGRATNDLLITLQQALGIDDPTFGDPQWVQGPLDGLLA